MSKIDTTKFCPSCDRSITPGAKRCSHCGAVLAFSGANKNVMWVVLCILLMLFVATIAKGLLRNQPQDQSAVADKSSQQKDMAASAADNPAPVITPIHQVDVATNLDQYITSLNGRFVYFLEEKYATSFVIIQKNVATGQTREVIDGHYVSLVKNGRFAGYLITSRHRYHSGGGAYECVYIVRPDAQEIFPVTDPKAKDLALQKQLTALDDKESMLCGEQGRNWESGA